MSIEHLKFPFYLIVHPFNGFWDLKYENKGKLRIALGLLFLFVVTVILKRQYAGFIVNFNRLSELNSIDELKFVVLPFFLWCVANWSLTTLMEGEGKFKEIVIAAGYSLLPMILVNLPTTFISNFLTIKEAPFYYFLDSFAYLWFLYLMFVGTLTVHQYTVKKTVLTIGLTLVVMGVIIFLGLLFFSLIQQIVSFILTIYQELVFRV